MSPDFEKSPCLLHFHFSWNKKIPSQEDKAATYFEKEYCPFQQTWKISTPQPPETAATFSVLKVDSKDLTQSLAALLN